MFSSIFVCVALSGRAKNAKIEITKSHFHRMLRIHIHSSAMLLWAKWIYPRKIRYFANSVLVTFLFQFEFWLEEVLNFPTNEHRHHYPRKITIKPPLYVQVVKLFSSWHSAKWCKWNFECSKKSGKLKLVDANVTPLKWIPHAAPSTSNIRQNNDTDDCIFALRMVTRPQLHYIGQSKQAIKL